MNFKIRSIFYVIAASILSAVSLSSCKDSSFKIEGEIEGAAENSVILEKSDFYGQWIPLDSARLSKSGKFKLSWAAPAAPEIYRLVYGGRYIYFPIDSTENLKLKTTAAGFGKDFSLEGSEKAVTLANFEKEFNNLPATISADSLNSFKKIVFSKYMLEPQGSIVGYHILTKIKGGKQLFDPTVPEDIKYFAAVATGFKSMRPDDPHTALLERTSLQAIKERNAKLGKILEIAGEEVSMIDITLPDETGKEIKLSDVAGKGKPVVLIFSFLTGEDSPAINYQLSQIYNKNKGNVEFYHVSPDPDQYSWREAAVNLPWVTVFDNEGAYSGISRKYNVGGFPTFFIYDAEGNLKSRAESFDQIEKQIK